jgi:signal transduction histidine kinase
LRASEAIRNELQQRVEFEKQLIGIVSHDLASPLFAIRMTMDVLRREELSPAHAELMGRVQLSAQRALRMTRDLLQFTEARSSHGISVNLHSIDLSTLVRDVVAELRLSFPARTFELVQEGRALGRWDGDRIAQVLTNLATNATKYADAGTPVTIRSQQQDDCLLLQVHNEGKVIPPDVRARLFEPLWRGTLDIDNSGRSIGLGLFIAHRIVEAHGGTIEVSSTSETGTCFTVRLPRRARPTALPPG